MLVARLGLLTLAVVACAWFTLGIRSVIDQQAVTNLVDHATGPLTPRQESRALGQLNSAAVLDPDGEMDVLRAHVLLDAGHHARARQVLRALLAREPKNLEAWTVLRASSQRGTPDWRLAAARILQLVPPVPATGS